MPRPRRFTSKRTLAPQRAPGIYASTYDPIRGAAICKRIAAGESIRSICRDDPSMPTGKTVWNWARAHPEFAAMKAHALSVARTRDLAEQAARDEARWEKVMTAPRAAWNAGLDGYDLEIGGEIATRLMMGEALTAICREPKMPCVGTVYNWLRRHPEFLQDYRRAKAMVEEIMVERSVEGLPFVSERESWPLLRRTVRAAEKAARRLSLKRYAPREGPAEFRVLRVICDE